MASTSTAIENEFTPRRNPRRSCARKEPWNFDNEDENDENKDTSDIDDYDDIDFQVYTTTPHAGQTAAGCSSNDVNYRYRNLTAAQRNKKLNKFTVDYDPDNDVFIHDVLSVNFNADYLKDHIKNFMKTSGVPAYKRALNKSMKKIALKTPPRRQYKKRNPSVRKKREPRVVEPDSSEDSPEIATPSYPLKLTPESTLRAMIYTRDFLKRLAQKRKDAAAREANRPPPNERKVDESEILKGVVAFVDVISHSDEDISCVIRKELEKLGAAVVPNFTKSEPVSVILFNDGHVSTYQKAKKRGIPLVSVLWIEECRKLGIQAPTEQFPPPKMERYESPAFVKELKKRKFVYATERMNPRKQRKRQNITPPEVLESESESEMSSEEASTSDLHGPAWLKEIEGSNGTMRILVNMTGVTEDQFRDMMEEPDDSEKYEISPLPMRLLHKLAKDLSAKNSSNADTAVTSTSNETENVSDDVQANASSSASLSEECLVSSNKKESDSSEESDSDSEEAESDDSESDENVDKISIEEKETPVTRRVSARTRAVRRQLTY